MYIYIYIEYVRDMTRMSTLNVNQACSDTSILPKY